MGCSTKQYPPVSNSTGNNTSVYMFQFIQAGETSQKFNIKQHVLSKVILLKCKIKQTVSEEIYC